MTPANPTLPRWLLPVLTGVLAVLGAGSLVAAAFASSPAPTPAPATGSPTPAPTRTIPSVAQTAAPAPAASASTSAPQPDDDTPTDTPVAELTDPGWVTTVAAAGEIPERALAAYAGAALATAQSHPGCGLGWNTLAAIGYVESAHGTMNGASIGEDGVATPPIVGVALNGDGVAKIADTDSGELDGDTTWDRAVGPMQFLPSSWRGLGLDGNRDGVVDVNQIDDAVLTAAAHLCEVGGDLTVAENWIKAIGAYNDDASYNNKVAEAATRYGALA